MPSTQAGQVLATPTLKQLARSLPSPGNIWLTMYPTSVPAFGSREVRQAMNWAINKATLARITYGTTTPWGAPFPTDIADFATFPQYGHDPAAGEATARAGGREEGLLRNAHRGVGPASPPSPRSCSSNSPPSACT